MLAGLFKIVAGSVNLLLCDGVHGEPVECSLQVLHVVGQVGVGGNNHIAHQPRKRVAQIGFLLSGEVHAGNNAVGLFKLSNHIGTGIDGLVTIGTVFVLGIVNNG